MLMWKCYAPWIGSPYLAIFMRCLTAYYYRTDYLTKFIIKIIYFGLNVYFSGCAGAAPAWGTHLLLVHPGYYCS